MMTPVKKRCFQVFQVALLALPIFFLAYLIKLWFWFLYPLPTNALEYATGLLIVFWLIGLWKLDFPKPRFSSRWQALAFGLFLLAVTLATVKIVLHLNKGRAVPLGIWKGWFMAPASYFLMLISTFRSKSDLFKLIEVTIGLVTLTAGAMLLQFFTGWLSPVTATYDLRLVWPYLDPLSGLGTSGNYPALFLAPFLCLAVVMMQRSEDRLTQAYYGLSAIVMAVTVYFTKSYGAWVAIIGACSLSSFLFQSGKKRWILIPCLTLILLVGLYFDQKNTEKFIYAVDTEEEAVIGSGKERLNIWNVSWDLIQRDPLWGVGPGQFQRAFERQAPFTLGREVSRKEVNHALHPHNTFLMFWLSNGLLGLISFVFLLVMLYVPLPKEWRLIFAAPLLYYLAHGLIEAVYWKNDLSYSFWWLAAAMIIAQNFNLLSGSVSHGIKVGRELGFPTANLELDINLDKPHGVYLVFLKIEKKKKRGLLYFGPRKTEGLPENIVCEMTILDFDGDLYGKQLHFKIGKRIRGPMDFDSPEALKAQIQKDVLVAQHLKA